MVGNLITLDINTYNSLQQELIELRQVVACWESAESATTWKNDQQQMRLFIEYTPAAIAIFDRQMRYLQVSRRWREDYGLDNQEFIGRSSYEVFPQTKHWQEIHQRCLAGNIEKCEEDIFPRVDGTVDWVKWEIHPWYEDSGEVGGIIIFAEVITARKQAEAALKCLNEELEAKVEERTAALRQSEARFQRLADNVPGMMYELSLKLDGTLHFSYVSSGSREVLGLAPEQIQKDALITFAYIYPEDIPGVQAAIAHSAQTLQDYEHDWRVVTPSGQHKWVKGFARPERQPDGEVIWHGYLFDISEQQAALSDRKLAEQRLQEQAQFLQSIWEGVDYGIYVLDVLDNGTEFRFLNFNPAIIKASPMPLEPLFGKILAEALPADMAHLYRQRYRECVNSGKTMLFEESFWANGQETWWEINITPLWNSTSQISQLIVTVIDITERKQAEEELKASQHFIQRVADSSPNILYIFDLEERRNVYVNQELAIILDYSPEEMQQMGANLIAHILHPDDVDKLKSHHQKILTANDGDIFKDEFRLRRGNGEWCWLYNWETPFMRNNDGTIRQILGVSTDITERKQAEIKLQQQAQNLENTLYALQRTQSQLIQSEKMSSIGNMVAGIAHEINNPVNFIHGNLIPASEYAQDLLRLIELYQQHYPNPPTEIQAEIADIDLNFLKEDLIKLLQSMRLGTQRIREIVLSLRNFSRLDESEVKDVDIHEGIDSTLMILQNRLKAKPDHPEISVIKEYEKLPPITCYPGQLNQVFMNILSNAIDALEESVVNGKTTDHPSICIRTEILDSSWVAIRIADNGRGIPQNILSKLFDPFFTTKDVGKGTGLGLSISYQIVVDKHRGKLSCHSTPGKGAEFVIEIPVSQ
ncbi:PAS domain S-box protein [Calothrix sp. PCC 7507]|uniref:PAS domain-containing sensor histidine kinase n=1 Tax=Calothrix sp. PCC 7507 TaxID=99598 RepID=UPI00029EEF5B|nr:PAS domain S-box protein [Calothrix sp. PCC 7507]AFY36042.1 PAS/PAC sensor signal transduction histidine kinase [Calothrix sp. PCC 7507]